jgi:hypothetical protein
MSGIRQQSERQAVLGREPAVRLPVVGRDAEHDGAELAEVVPGIAEAAGLLGAARRVVRGIEVEDHVPAGEAGERNVSPLAVPEGERWWGVARLEHRLLVWDQGMTSAAARTGA